MTTKQIAPLGAAHDSRSTGECRAWKFGHGVITFGWQQHGSVRRLVGVADSGRLRLAWGRAISFTFPISPFYHRA